jgi:hypothetical protein
MARGLGSLLDETLSLILGQFCLQCSKARDYTPRGRNAVRGAVAGRSGRLACLGRGG